MPRFGGFRGSQNARPDRASERSDHRDNLFKFDISKSAALSRDLGPGIDTVEIKERHVDQIRIIFTSAEVGDGDGIANLDGALAVRIQAENGSGALTGRTFRFDDEGIIFRTKGDATFDVRDLVSGAERGDQFDVVVLGTSGGDTFDFSGSDSDSDDDRGDRGSHDRDEEWEAYYINGGGGDDRLTGGNMNDFLVGGSGSDILSGRDGNDSFIGGTGDDFIRGGNGNDRVIVNISLDGSDNVDLGAGNDIVSVTAAAGSQIRLTFTSAEVGNGTSLDSGLLANQDGGLAVRMQLEDGAGALTGAVSRYDDEGITFIASAGATFDVRDLVSGTERGDGFQIVKLGTSGDDVIDDAGRAFTYYTNGGGGNDTLGGGTLADFLVGGAGNDRLNGNEGDDSFIGGGGADVFVFTDTTSDDRILDFVSGTDQIDFTALAITSANVSTMASGADTIISVDTNLDATVDFTITLVNAGSPAAGDYLF